MFKRAGFFVLCVLMAASAAFAQDYRVEGSGYFGWTFSEGVPINPVTIGGETFNEVNPTSGASYGFSFGVFFTENMEIEFAWDRQDSALEGKGRGVKREFVDMNLNNYHANFVYNFGDDRSTLRPFIFGGLGATQASPDDIMGQSIESSTRFSSNWGGGLKAYPARNVGIKLMARWVPTYVKSEPGGIWCSPYWPWVCYQLVDNQYINQFQLAGGVTFRF